MRLDKYLWATRYFKTRNQATEACKKGHIKVNNAAAKASKEVFVGEAITVRKDQINYELEVLDLPPSRVGAKLVNLYRRDTTPSEAFEKKDLLKYSKEYYRKKGTGRPTKKDRRDIDDFVDDFDPNTE